MDQTLAKISPEFCLSFAGDLLIFAFPKLEPLGVAFLLPSQQWGRVSALPWLPRDVPLVYHY